MSEVQLEIQCPSCQTKLSVPGHLQGQVVACPKCQQQLQLGQATPLASITQTPTTQASTPQALNAPPPILPPPVQAPAPPPPTGGQSWGAHPPVQSPSSSLKRSSSSVKRKKGAPEPEDEESFAGNLGYYLVATAILASLAPMVGLEHKALRHAGQFAPIIGVLLGLAGSGLIASRGKTHSFVIAAISAVLCLGSGVAGYVFLKNEGQVVRAEGRRLSKKEREAKAKEELERLKGTQKRPQRVPIQLPLDFQNQRKPGDIPQAPVFPRGGAISNPDKPSGATGNPAEHGFNSPFANRGNGQIGQSGPPEGFTEFQEQHRKEIEEARRRHQEAQDRIRERMRTGRGGRGRFTGRSPGSPQLPNEANVGNQAPSGRNNLAGSNVGGNAPSTMTTDPGGYLDMFRRNQEGLDASLFRARGNSELQNNFKFEKIVGSESAMGKIFFQNQPIQAIEFGVFERGTLLLASNGSGPDHENRILVPDGTALVGLNLSVSNGNLVGIQGVFGKPVENRAGKYNVKETSTSKWLGQSSPHPRTTITRGKAVHGLAVFSTARSVTGLQLITPKNK